MKSLKLLAVAAIFGAFMTSCVAESINEDEQQIEELDIISGTGNDGTVVTSDGDDD